MMLIGYTIYNRFDILVNACIPDTIITTVTKSTCPFDTYSHPSRVAILSYVSVLLRASKMDPFCQRSLPSLAVQAPGSVMHAPLGFWCNTQEPQVPYLTLFLQGTSQDLHS